MDECERLRIAIEETWLTYSPYARFAWETRLVAVVVSLPGERPVTYGLHPRNDSRETVRDCYRDLLRLAVQRVAARTYARDLEQGRRPRDFLTEELIAQGLPAER